MIKNKIDYKLINCAIIMLIIFLLYQTGNLWLGIIGKIWSVSLPFLIGFVIAYALYPFLKFLMDNKIPKSIGIIIIIVILVAIVALFGVTVFPLLFGQLSSLFNSIITFFREISFDYNINLGSFQESLTTGFNDIIVNLGKYVSNGAINIIGVSLGYLSTAFIAFSAAMYFLSDMDKIRKNVKKFLRKKSRKMYRYVSLLDREMRSYLTGFIRIMLISVIEYTIVYIIIGHPNAVLLGFLAMLASLIPYFGGILNNVVAAITAFVISPALFIKTIIAFVVLSAIDGYVINPLVYGKTNKVHPLVVIMSVFAGGALFGVIGIIISLPLAIIIISTFKYFKEDLIEKIDDYKEEKALNS